MGFEYVRVSHVVPAMHKKRAASSACATGGFYKSPKNGDSVDSTKPLVIKWDPSCLTADAADIYLYAPSLENSRIHVWENVAVRDGEYDATLKAKWWNATASQGLQITIVNTGSPPFMSVNMPAGPVFTATYSGTPAQAGVGTPDTDGGITNVGSLASNNTHMSGGKVAAAILLPMIFIGLLVFGYLKVSRMKAEKERQKWTEKVDKRMSTIAPDWSSITPGGAQAAIRSSMAFGKDRMSAFSFGAVRPPSSVYNGEGGRAGVGAQYGQDDPQMSQRRPGMTAAAFADRSSQRVSKVSFAADPRGSTYDTRGNTNSRAFHEGFVPPIPRRQNTMDVDYTQRDGPMPLSTEDIRARLSGEETGHDNMDDVLPALNMMRTGGHQYGQSGDNDYLFEHSPPLPPVPAASKSSDMPNHTDIQPSVMTPDEMLRAYSQRRGDNSPGLAPISPALPPMSPDDMLRAYAERNRNGNNSPAFPPPAMYNGNGMRTLYSPSGPSQTQTQAKRNSGMSSRWNEDDAYVGTAE